LSIHLFAAALWHGSFFFHLQGMNKGKKYKCDATMLMEILAPPQKEISLLRSKKQVIKRAARWLIF
jgi:hypothetical protein